MIPLTNDAQLKDLYKESFTQKMAILKHSSTCPISARAYKVVIEALAHDRVKMPVYLVVVQDYRDISNKIEEDLGITHESPQLLILKDAQVIGEANHYDITEESFVL